MYSLYLWWSSLQQKVLKLRLTLQIKKKNKNEGKTIEKSRFVELSEDDLDVIVDRAEAQFTKNTAKWRVKLFQGKHKQ